MSCTPDNRPIASYTVLAGVVLGTELMHGSLSPEARTQLIAEIQSIIDSLWSCGTSSLVVQRGELLLRRFIASAEGQRPVPAMSETRSTVAEVPSVPAAQDLWPSLPVEGATADAWLNASEDVWSNALVALENEGSNGWWTTLL